MAMFSKKTEDKKTAGTKTPVVKTDVATPAMSDLYKADKAKAAKRAIGEERSIHSQAYRVLRKPLVTEKAATLASLGKYVFMVANEANKVEVAKAIREIYGVTVLDVNIINQKGKRVFRGRIAGQRKDWRKAIVTLKKGETIQLYEGV